VLRRPARRPNDQSDMLSWKTLGKCQNMARSMSGIFPGYRLAWEKSEIDPENGNLICGDFSTSPGRSRLSLPHGWPFATESRRMAGRSRLSAVRFRTVRKSLENGTAHLF
jgi:hypothetical protein